MFERIPRRLAALMSSVMIAAGLVLIVWLLTRLPAPGQAASPRSLSVDEPQVRLAASATVAVNDAIPTSPDAAATVATVAPTVTPTVTPDAVVSLAGDAPFSAATRVDVEPVILGLAQGLPTGVVQSIDALTANDPSLLIAPGDAPTATLRLDWQPGNAPDSQAVYREVYALAARFDTVFPQAEATLVADLWGNPAATDAIYQRVGVLSDTLPALVSLLGEAGPAVQAVADVDALLGAAWADEATLVLLPFDRLRPELVAFAVDGQNPVDNRFDVESYPLVATLYAHSLNDDDDQSVLGRLTSASGGTNRDPDSLTVLAMTGVTAMVRQTAAQMDQFGPEWVAEVVGPELAAADITAISNEVPFVPGCVTNTSAENLTFCSHPDYMAALEAVGADIIGLTGNHQNDYGRADALASLEIYAEADLPVYGGGRNKEAAFAPLYIEHNGNRLAFLGANSYGPAFAWATDDGPGSAEFDLNILSATIRAVKEKDKADIVLVELQYQESYGVAPLFDQRQNFRLLSQTGADIVTGVQSHVPQALEFEDGRLILYGLGNLFFDQMWRQDTREGLIVKHSFYAGRYISTQVLTTLLYDFGQPRWSSDEERESLLRRVFDASYWPRLSQQ